MLECWADVSRMVAFFQGASAKDVYKTGLSDLTSVCEHVHSTFEVIFL